MYVQPCHCPAHLSTRNTFCSLSYGERNLHPCTHRLYIVRKLNNVFCLHCNFLGREKYLGESWEEPPPAFWNQLHTSGYSAFLCQKNLFYVKSKENYKVFLYTTWNIMLLQKYIYFHFIKGEKKIVNRKLFRDSIAKKENSLKITKSCV